MWRIAVAYRSDIKSYDSFNLINVLGTVLDSVIILVLARLFCAQMISCNNIKTLSLFYFLLDIEGKEMSFRRHSISKNSTTAIC